MDFSINDEQKTLKEGMQSFGSTNLTGLSFDRNVWTKCADQGILGACLDEKFGGSNETFLDLCLMLEALGTARNSGMVFSMCAQLAACSLPINKYGTVDQKNAYLGKLSSGEWIGAHAMTESNSGSNSYQMSMVAGKVESGYRLNGQKVFITNAPCADLFVCFAMTNKGKGYFGGISCFLVPRDSEGLIVSQVNEKMGLPGSQMGTVEFNDVFVREGDRLGEEGAGSKIFSDSILMERVAMSAFHLGAVKRILNETLSYAKQRTIGGESIRQHQAVSHKLAKIQMNNESVRWFIYKLAKDFTNKSIRMEDAASAKVLTSEYWVQAATDALQIHGATGYMMESDAQQWVKDSLASKLYSGSNDVLLNIVAKSMGL